MQHLRRRAELSGEGRQKEKPGNESRASKLIPGDVLLSHAVYREVPSGLKGLTAVFGMGTGVAPSLRSPGKPLTVFRNQESG
jgi:hypothetical protein